MKYRGLGKLLYRNPSLIPKRRNNEDLLDFVERLSTDYLINKNLGYRKSKGQFFTPRLIAIYMADKLFKSVQKKKIEIIDLGAGIGILTTAVCLNYLKSSSIEKIHVTAIEFDSNLIPYLRKNLKTIQYHINQVHGKKFYYRIVNENLVDYYLKTNLDEKYDLVISNPPYRKISNNTINQRISDSFGFRFKNYYTLFMGIATNLVKVNGRIVFLTPRSFCSGIHFLRFRQFLLNKMKLRSFLIFNSRTKIFNNVTQELVVSVAEKSDKNKSVDVLYSDSLIDIRKTNLILNLRYNDIVRNSKYHLRIVLPNTIIQTIIVRSIDKLSSSIEKNRYMISTGALVPFRVKQKYLIQNSSINSTDAIPIIWMQNLNLDKISWPLINKHATHLQLNAETEKLSIENSNYLFIKRLSSKEQRRRLHIVPYYKDLKFEKISVENHVNYLYHLDYDLNEIEMEGILNLLASGVYKNYFNSFNGTTQVNSSDLLNIPFPDKNQIIQLGKLFSKSFYRKEEKEKIILQLLKINLEYKDTLK